MPSIYTPRPDWGGSNVSNPPDLSFNPDFETCFDQSRLLQLWLSKGGTEQEFVDNMKLVHEKNGVKWYCGKIGLTNGRQEHKVSTGKYGGAIVTIRRKKMVRDAQGNFQLITLAEPEWSVTKDQKKIDWSEFWKSWNDTIGNLYNAGNPNGQGKGDISSSYFIWIILGIASLFLIWLARR